MSLDNIELSPIVIAELYGYRVLVKTSGTSTAAPTVPASLTVPASPVAAPPVPTGYRFLGNNQKSIVIVVNSPEAAFLPDDQLAFLTKMLEACKMNIGDVAIVNQATSPVAITALKRQLSPAVLLLFGMEPVEIALPINFPQFKLQAYDQCTYLCVPSLDQLVSLTEESKSLKGKLWACLKTLFQI